LSNNELLGYHKLKRCSIIYTFYAFEISLVRLASDRGRHTSLTARVQFLNRAFELEVFLSPRSFCLRLSIYSHKPYVCLMLTSIGLNKTKRRRLKETQISLGKISPALNKQHPKRFIL